MINKSSDSYYCKSRDARFFPGIRDSEKWPDRWGEWVFKPNLTLVLDEGYWVINLKEINSTAQLCQEVWAWLDRDLIKAFGDIFVVEEFCCPNGVEVNFSGAELAARYAELVWGSVNKAPVPPKVRYEILKRDNFCCQACGAKASADSPLHVDHIVPRKHGGTNDPSNLQVLCATCNLGKGASL